MPSADYLPIAIAEFRRLKRVAEGALAQVSPEQVFQVDGPEDNSLAVIMKHMSGNMISRWRNFLAADGEKPDRDRDGEFILSGDDTHEALFARWGEGWRETFKALEPLQASDLERPVTIRRESLTVLQATQRQLTHYAYHIGQIVFLAKHLAGAKWKTLSIARGKSVEFNQTPAKYLPKQERT